MSANPSAVVAVGRGGEEPIGLEALERLGSASPPLYLSPSPDLSRLARDASKYLFSFLLPFCPKSPLDHLLADEDFDAEQIWHQIELQSRPLVSTLRRGVRRFEKMDPAELFGGVSAKKEGVEKVVVERGGGGDDGKDGAADMEVEEEGEEEVGEEEDEEEEEEKEEEEKGESGGVEDRFLKIKELEEYMEKDEAREYGGKEGKEMEEDDDEDEDEDLAEGKGGSKDKFGDFYGEGDDDGSEDSAAYVKYDDFFGGKRKKSSLMEDKKKNRGSFENLGLKDLGSRDKEEVFPGGSESSETDSEQKDDGDFGGQNNETLSTYEKEQKKLQSKIEQIEKENLGPKSWTMLGEVTAAKRPKNSALEVDLDFEHNKGRPPVTAEESTTLVEDIILKRIREVKSEGHLDEVQRAPSLPSKAPKELKDLDENQSKKGLAEIYEEEYAQRTGLSSAPLSFSDEQKKEASLLFKKLCLKLDALSHFHFTPKPVIEDMSIQANVPALAMEEIAPMAVSDAAMLAPEEIFSGKGDIKEEAELTQAERRRRRANKKRKFKAETAKRKANKAPGNTYLNHPNGKEDS